MRSAQRLRSQSGVFCSFHEVKKAGDDLGSTRSERKSVEKSDLTLSVDFGQCKVAIFTFERMSQDAEIYLREDGRCSPVHIMTLQSHYIRIKML